MAAPAFDHLATSGRLPIAAGLSGAGRGLAAAATIWVGRVRSRGALRRLPLDRLDDLGLTVADVRRELAKGFWQA